MFIPPGFASHTVTTQLGPMVYYTQQGEPWDLTHAPDTRPRMVFLHAFGGGSSAYEWSKVYPAFAAEYQIIAPDLIGWGRSAHPARDYSPEDYVALLTEFLAQMCPDPAIVVASALTAAFTVRVAIDRPDLFKCLITTTLAGLADFENDYRQSNFAQFAQFLSVPVISQVLYGAGVANRWGIRNYLEQRQFARSHRIYPEIVEAYLQSAQQDNAEYAALAFVRGDLCFDLSQYIGQLTVPTAILWGKSPEFTGPEVGRRLAEMNPQAIRIFYQLDDVGFTPQLELPGVTVGLIHKFLPLLEETAVTTARPAASSAS